MHRLQVELTTFCISYCIIGDMIPQFDPIISVHLLTDILWMLLMFSLVETVIWLLIVQYYFWDEKTANGNCTISGTYNVWRVNYLPAWYIFQCRANSWIDSSLNALFGKLGRFASEDVFLQVVESKCLPILMYCTLAGCLMKKSYINSSDFVVNHLLMKLFK